jgi:hypothetical protein
MQSLILTFDPPSVPTTQGAEDCDPEDLSLRSTNLLWRMAGVVEFGTVVFCGESEVRLHLQWRSGASRLSQLLERLQTKLRLIVNAGLREAEVYIPCKAV